MSTPTAAACDLQNGQHLFAEAVVRAHGIGDADSVFLFRIHINLREQLNNASTLREQFEISKPRSKYTAAAMVSQVHKIETFQQLHTQYNRKIEFQSPECCQSQRKLEQRN